MSEQRVILDPDGTPMREVWRIRGTPQEVRPSGWFLANSRNWRIHPQAQRQALKGVLKDIGWIDSVKVNLRNHPAWGDERGIPVLFDGHCRIEEALKEGDDVAVPLESYDLTPAEEAEALATLDPLSALAGTDAAQLDALLREVSTGDAAVQQILADLAEEAGALPVKAGNEDEGSELPVEAPDLVFPSDNEWGVPSLLMRAQPDGVPMPVERWGRRARGSAMPGTWHFYTDDYKFNAIWDDPTPIVVSGCRAIVEPNVSTGPGTPAAVALWGIYRKRWIARWAQQYDIDVYVDLNIEGAFTDINLLGVPKGWRSYATRGYDTRLELLGADYETAQRHANGEPVAFLVVGGGKATRAHCIERGWVHIPQEAHDIEGRYNNG